MATQKVYGRTRTEQGTAADEAVTKAQLDGKSNTGHTHPVTELATTSGTANNTSYLRGDGAWISIPLVSLTDAEAGTLTTQRLWSPQRVNQAIQALAPVKSTDARLSDARTPTAHKTSHATGGTDALTPGDIGAAVSGHSHNQIVSPNGQVTVTATDAGVALTGGFGQDTGDLVPTSPFTGALRFVKVGNLVFMSGYVARSDAFTGWVDTGVRVPANMRQSIADPTPAHTGYNTTFQYRFRVQPDTGAVEIQRTGTITTFMSVSTFWAVPVA